MRRRRGRAGFSVAFAAGGRAILLVDDNAPLRVTMRRLAGLGYRVCDAGDGPAALAIIDSGRRFDLLPTDLGLPGGLPGYDLADQARRRQPDLKILYTTGYGTPRERLARVARSPE